MRRGPVALPPELYRQVIRGVEFLQHSGDPDELARTAERLEACRAVEPFASRSGILEPAVTTLRTVEGIARRSLVSLEVYGFGFNFQAGKLILPPRNRRGPRGGLLNILIAGAFDDLDPAEWTARETFEAIRNRLRGILPAHVCDSLTDGKIKGVIERHT